MFLAQLRTAMVRKAFTSLHTDGMCGIVSRFYGNLGEPVKV